MKVKSSMYAMLRKRFKRVRSGSVQPGPLLKDKVQIVRSQIAIYDNSILSVETHLIWYMAELYRLEYSQKGVLIRRYEKLSNKIADLKAFIRARERRQDELIAMLEQYAQEARQEMAAFPSVRLFGF